MNARPVQDHHGVTHTVQLNSLSINPAWEHGQLVVYLNNERIVWEEPGLVINYPTYQIHVDRNGIVHFNPYWPAGFSVQMY